MCTTAGDPHGTSTQTVSAANAAVTTRRLDPFGNPRGAQPTWPGNHGFVNGPADPTGLTHLGAREYDPTIGRFTSVDPILNPADTQSLNGFAYADNSPVTNADPTGLLCANGPDGMCHTKNGNVSTPGLSEQGGGAVDFDHGGIVTTVTATHVYLAGVELPHSAPPSAELADYASTQLAQYRSRYERAFGRSLGELTPSDVLTLLLGCPMCNKEFRTWLREAAFVLADGASRGHLGRDGGSLILRLSNVYSRGGVSLRIGSTTAANVSDTTPIFRGVGTDHHAYRDALRGVARPGDPDGHADPVLHNRGLTRTSSLTSWTTDPQIAEEIAGKGGVILRTTVQDLQARGVSVLASPDLFGENEILVRGVVPGLTVEER